MLLGFWKFSKSSMCSDDYLGNSSWKAYFSEQEIQDEREKYELKEKLIKFFRYDSNMNYLTLEQLRIIRDIIKTAVEP